MIIFVDSITNFIKMKKSTNKPIQNKTDILTPVISHDSPRKCNLSFSINFDFYDTNSDNSTDSENADLQIDISEVNDNEPSSKHKRETIEEISVLNEMEEEIERQLDAKAAKTNLTATNVKNILKHVITYEHLMSMVQKWLQNDVNCGPKLTRAKAKKLADAKVMPWPITIGNKTSSEVQALIQEELPEDSSDEEYKPEHDKQSDDDREVESTMYSDIESQSSAPADIVNITSTEQYESLHVQYDPEGIFKIPVTPHVSTQEEGIGQRTRSKLSLSETSLEQIEQAFIPPDITADMDDWGFEPDEDWDNFKKEFTQPLAQELATEDDPEADPEYNILEDEETDLLDKEELRTDKAVEVSRKESYDLIAELLEELSDTFSTQEQEVLSEKKTDNIIPPIENNTMNCSTNLLPVLAEPELPTLINPAQRFLLATQFRQHVQLMVQHFVMAYMHPEYNLLAKICKQNLNSIRYLNNGPNSAFNVENLEEALKLVSIWENKFSNAKFYANFKKGLTEKVTKTKMYCTSKWGRQQFFSELEKSFVESKALMYPQLLPHMPFKGRLKQTKNTIPYLKSEENLVAFGIEQFLPHIASKPSKFKNKRMQLFDAAQLTHQYLLPCRNTQGILYHISKCRASYEENPIKHYFEKGCAPRIIHYVLMAEELKAPKTQPIEFLPLRWRIYLNKQRNHKNDSIKTKHMLDSYANLDLGKQKFFMNELMKLYPIIPSNHPLRNPIVNMLPKILPATSNPKDSNTSMNATPNNRTSILDDDNSEDKKVFDNNLQTTEKQIGINKYKTLHNLLKGNAEEVKSVQTDKLQVKNNTRLNSILTKSSKISDNSPQISSGLRKTTPRLAKTRSAQNMKLMAQVLGSKNSSNCNILKSKEKDSADKIVSGDCTVSKIDNEEEIAELMLASTTIIKDSVSRKKAKQTRELEIIKRLIKAENPSTEEERETKFAASYLQKLLLTLESNNPETFRTVIKLYLDYSDKLDSINQTICDSPFLEELHLPNKEILQNSAIQKDILTVKLYEDICKKLQNYPEICAVFLLFLKPYQAAMVNKSVEYMMLQKMNDFVRVAQIYFAKQPSRIAKMMQAITQLSSNLHTTLGNVHTVMSSVFKGHPLVMDLFLQVLPTAKPPESLFASHMFENLTCPLGSCDKNVTFNTENASELYENIELPMAASQEDPYGGEHCKCDCHNTDDPNLKNNPEHCVSCGTRFLNGRIYLQTLEGLRPAKITFPGEDQEKLENIARVSLKTADKINPPISSKKRRKTPKNDSSHNDICQKQCATKYLLLKDNEDNEKTEAKSKRGVKFALKTTNQRKVLKRVGIVDHVIANKKMHMLQYKNKEENKTEQSDILLKCNELSAIKEKINECTETSTCMQLSIQNNSFRTKVIAKNASSASKNECNLSSKDAAAAILTTAVEDIMQSKSDSTNIKPWTRQEDMILLQSIKKEYSENSFLLISEKLENRTVEQVKERCQTLLSLLQKMM